MPLPLPFPLLLPVPLPLFPRPLPMIPLPLRSTCIIARYPQRYHLRSIRDVIDCFTGCYNDYSVKTQ